MRRLIRGLFTFCALAASSAAEEPSYGGRILSEWLADVRCCSGVTLVGAPDPPKDAVRAMGTNAIPTLLKWISYERSAPKPTLLRRVPLSSQEERDGERRAQPILSHPLSPPSTKPCLFYH